MARLDRLGPAKEVAQLERRLGESFPTLSYSYCIIKSDGANVLPLGLCSMGIAAVC